jgi:hypothetical protein
VKTGLFSVGFDINGDINGINDLLFQWNWEAIPAEKSFGKLFSATTKSIKEGEKDYGSRCGKYVLHKGRTVARAWGKGLIGTILEGALQLAGLDGKVQGVVTDCYRIIQNEMPNVLCVRVGTLEGDGTCKQPKRLLAYGESAEPDFQQ